MAIKYATIKNITYADTTAIKVGSIPPNSIITEIRVHVATAFNGGGTDLVDIGTASNISAYAANVDVSSVGDATVTRQSGSYGVLSTSGSTDVYAVFKNGATAATAGSAYIVIEYVQL